MKLLGLFLWPFKLIKALTDLDSLIVRGSGWLGQLVGKHPSHFITSPIFLSFTLTLCLRDLHFVTDPEYLFVPDNSIGIKERAIVESLFPPDYDHYVPGHETRVSSRVEVILMPEDGSNCISADYWKMAKKVNDVIEAVTIRDRSGKNTTFDEVCAKHNGKCVTNDFLDLAPYLDRPDFKLKYPITYDDSTGKRYPLPAHLGGQVVENGYMTRASAIRLAFLLDPNANSVTEWESVTLKKLLKFRINGTNIFAVSSQSISQELVNNLHGGLVHLEYTVAVLVAFAVLCTMNCGPDGKCYVAVLGIINTLMAVGSAWGLLALAGVPWQAINLSGLFLLIGVGMDDAFIMLSAWKRTQSCMSVDDRLKMCFEDAVASITISSVTNVASFMVGSLAPGFASVQIFCAYTGAGIVFIYAWTLTFFGGCLAYSGRAEAKEKNHLLCVKPANVVFERISSWFRLDAHPIQFMVGSFLPRQLSKRWVKASVAVVCLAYWVASAYGVMTMNEGLRRQNLATGDSYSAAFYDQEDVLFRQNPYRFQIVVSNALDYSNARVVQNIEETLEAFMNCSYIDNRNSFVENWLDMFDRALDLKKELTGNVTLDTEQQFVAEVVDIIRTQGKGVPLQDYLVFNANKTKIVGSRFFLQSGPIQSAAEEMVMITQLRQIAANAPAHLNVTVFHPYNPYWDQFLQVRPSAVKIVGFSTLMVFLVTFALLPKRHRVAATFWVALVILSIEFGVCGSMAYFSIHLDVISMICLAVCVGFSVDFSAHIAYHYLSAPCHQNAMMASLSAIGIPVLQAAASTVLCVSFLTGLDSYIMSSFAVLMMLVIVYGTFHGLVLLPVLLSSFSGKPQHFIKTKFFLRQKRMDARDCVAFHAYEGTYKRLEENFNPNLTGSPFVVFQQKFGENSSTPKCPNKN